MVVRSIILGSKSSEESTTCTVFELIKDNELHRCKWEVYYTLSRVLLDVYVARWSLKNVILLFVPFCANPEDEINTGYISASNDCNN